MGRILKALVAEGLLARDTVTEGHYLGSGAVLLGQAAQRAFGLDKALPVLENVNATTEESVNLAVREGGESVVMLRVQTTLPLRFDQRTGTRFPLYTTASGKAILAFSDDAAQYVKSLPAQLRKVTRHTLETPEQLARQLRRSSIAVTASTPRRTSRASAASAPPSSTRTGMPTPPS